jgi:hypothetical protein
MATDIEKINFPKYEEFEVTHDYLRSDKPDTQVRIRKRTQNNRSTYTITNRQLSESHPVETRMQITQREYQFYLTMKDMNRATLHKKRRCFNYGPQVSLKSETNKRYFSIFILTYTSILCLQHLTARKL